MLLQTVSKIVGHSVSVDFEWSRADPFAIKMTIPTENGDVVWYFAVDLLINGGGEGDVKVTNHPSGNMWIAISDNEHSATVFVGHEYDLRHWAKTNCPQPADLEIQDWEIEEWLSSSAESE